MTEADVIQPSASIASTGPGIRYIGNRCYGYSGMFESQGDQQTAFDFTSGSGIILATFQWNGFVHPSNPSAGNNSTMFLYFNNESIAFLKTDTSSEQMLPTVRQTFIIPPFTRVQVYLDASTNDATLVGAANFTGRVYGAD